MRQNKAMPTSNQATYDMLARVFMNEGIRVCFALLGDANMHFASSLHEQGCTMIYVRHEHCAVAAAMAYARKTGSVGIATVTCGPGLSQVMTALPAAARASLPLVIFAGEQALSKAWHNQGINQSLLLEGSGAAYHSLHQPERMPTAIRDAFIEAQTERRPVVLGVPFDLQDQDWQGSGAVPKPSKTVMPKLSPMPAHEADLGRGLSMIEASKKIIVIAGLGAAESGAKEACQSLANRCDALLATTLPARGLFHDDGFSIGIAGGFSSEVARECFAEADLVISVGSSLSHHNTDGGKLFPSAKVLQINTRPTALSQGRITAAAHIRADARLAVEALTQGLKLKAPLWRTPELAKKIASTPADTMAFDLDEQALDPRDVVAALEANLPSHWQTVNSSGHCSYFFAHMPSRPFEKFLTIREFGAIGNGISFAIGVAAAYPEETIVLFDGDGSLLMHIQELETIKRHKLNILVVVMNDGAYGSEVHKLRASGRADVGAQFGSTDFAAIARGFGLEGKTVDDLSRLPKMVAEFSQTKEPAVWNVPVSTQVVSPVIRRAYPNWDFNAHMTKR